MDKTTDLYCRLEQGIINETRLSTVNGAVLAVLTHIRMYMHDAHWPQEVQSEKDPAVKVFSRLLCNLDYAKIRMQAELIPSKKPYCEECACKANDKDFICLFTDNTKDDCVLLNIARKLKQGIKL